MQRTVDVHDPGLARITRTLIERLRPLRIVLFGSRARGDASESSDYDLMVEIEEERQSEVRRLVSELRAEQHWRADVVVTTPAEYAEQRDDVGLIAYQVEREGRLLYARDETASRRPPRASGVREPHRGRPRSVGMWVRRAESDFMSISRLLDGGPPIADAAMFHSHQCVEKYLKALIVWTGRVPPRTHDLDELLPLCPEPLRGHANVRLACSSLSEVIGRSRYPLGPEPTVEEARSAAEAAALVREAARAVLDSEVC